MSRNPCLVVMQKNKKKNPQKNKKKQTIKQKYRIKEIVESKKYQKHVTTADIKKVVKDSKLVKQFSVWWCNC